MAGVGSKVVFEDSKIKLWEFDLEPGERTPVHTHEMEYVFYVISGSTLEVFDADDKLVTPLEFNDGDVLPLRLEGDDLVVIGNDALRVPATESATKMSSPFAPSRLEEKKSCLSSEERAGPDSSSAVLILSPSETTPSH